MPYCTDGHEISSNCNNCPSEPVDVGQRIKTVLTAQVANNDVDNSLRDNDSNSIEGPVWWRIAGKTNWTLLVSEEFNVDDLNKNDEPDEYEWFTVPSYPKDILEFKACVDGDDEILEPDEGSRKKITNPDQSGTTNNCSRTERFYIKEPNHQPTGYLDSANCSTVKGWAKDPNTVYPIDIHFYADGNSSTGTFIGVQKANEYRSDLPYTDKYHGFTFHVPESLKDGKSHTIYAYGIDSQGGYNPVLNNSPKTVDHCISAAALQVIMNFTMED